MTDAGQKLTLVVIQRLQLGYPHPGQFGLLASTFDLEPGGGETGPSFRLIRVQFSIEAVVFPVAGQRPGIVARRLEQVGSQGGGSDQQSLHIESLAAVCRFLHQHPCLFVSTGADEPSGAIQGELDGQLVEPSGGSLLLGDHGRIDRIVDLAGGGEDVGSQRSPVGGGVAPVVSQSLAPLDDLGRNLSDPLDRLPSFVIVACIGEGEKLESLIDLRSTHPQLVAQPQSTPLRPARTDRGLPRASPRGSMRSR